MRQQYASDLEEIMRRAFHSRFGEDIPLSSEIIIEPARLFKVLERMKWQRKTESIRNGLMGMLCGCIEKYYISLFIVGTCIYTFLLRERKEA